MKKPKMSLPLASSLIALFVAVLLFPGSSLAAGPTEKVLHRFKGKVGSAEDGAFPAASLVADQRGNLYGTTFYGGSGSCVEGGKDRGCGTVFEVSPPAMPGGAWTETVLYSFQASSDGRNPRGNLIFDEQGNLYGTTQSGGAGGGGVVFQLAPPAAQGDPWTLTALCSFSGTGGDGARPEAGVVLDAAGNLYGTTESGGTRYNDGTVFQVSPPASKGSAWTKTILYSFAETGDAATPYGGLVLGKGGALYGTTVVGGKFEQYGAIVQLTPPKTKGGAWSEKVLYSFQGGSDGAYPYAGLIFDRSGNLYGMTWAGGSGCGSIGCGTVFLARLSGGRWTKTVLYSFTGGSDGAGPLDTLIFDKNGNLYGTTSLGGNDENGSGAAFRLSPPAAQGDPWTETTLHDFTGGSDGSTPWGGLIFGKGGALYGTTAFTAVNHNYGNGTVFKIVP